jgi:hypothetical protein
LDEGFIEKTSYKNPSHKRRGPKPKSSYDLQFSSSNSGSSSQTTRQEYSSSSSSSFPSSSFSSSSQTRSSSRSPKPVLKYATDFIVPSYLKTKKKKKVSFLESMNEEEKSKEEEKQEEKNEDEDEDEEDTDQEKDEAAKELEFRCTTTGLKKLCNNIMLRQNQIDLACDEKRGCYDSMQLEAILCDVIESTCGSAEGLPLQPGEGECSSCGARKSKKKILRKCFNTNCGDRSFCVDHIRHCLQNKHVVDFDVDGR